MSIELERRTDAPGDASHEGAAWALKERIRREEGVLKQRRGFFSDAYRRSETHLLFEHGPDGRRRTDGTTDGDLVGFVSARRDGYILFLAVSPDARGRGYGKRLVARIADEHRTVTCHARATNRAALEFYEAIGFDVERRIDGYYEDGGDAYYLKLGEDGGLTDRLSSLLR
ncbi:GNAT family N-acetyltransferase [Halobaculum sp. MBLA0147]|uniref:GNAT family N-acetyltransferase n=1 Tax=Halobaculum sp. MBLA0147 TaxID=3079934 RepID=UPI00352478FA